MIIYIFYQLIFSLPTPKFTYECPFFITLKNLCKISFWILLSDCISHLNKYVNFYQTSYFLSYCNLLLYSKFLSCWNSHKTIHKFYTFFTNLKDSQSYQTFINYFFVLTQAYNRNNHGILQSTNLLVCRVTLWLLYSYLNSSYQRILILRFFQLLTNLLPYQEEVI